jgi:hypothetical protein
LTRIIPRGLRLGDKIMLLEPSVMTNGLTFPAGVYGEVRVIYPGGVIVASDQATGGLLKAGTTCYREGDPEETAQPAAPRATAPGGDFEFDLDLDVKAGGQVGKLVKIFQERGARTLLDTEVRELLRSKQADLSDKQDAYAIFRYYRAKLVEIGFMRLTR